MGVLAAVGELRDAIEIKEKMEYINEIMPIKGMHCSKCVSAIERTLSELESVERVNVSLSAKNAHIKYDADKVNKDDFNRELKSLGYEIAEGKNISELLKKLFRKS